MRQMKKLSILLAGFLIGAFLFSACSDDEPTIPEAQAPDLPPQSTFIMDFDSFPDISSPAFLLKVIPGDTILRGNWGWAAGNVVVWSTLLKFTLAVPVAAFLESFKHQPILQPDDSWLWAYNITVSGITYTAKLYGKTNSEGTDWRMLLTKEGFYEDFEWYTGYSNLPLTEGTWTLNKDPNEPVPFIFISWSRNVEEGAGDIKYTNIIPSDPGNGSYIYYGITNDLDYNAFFDIFNQVNNNHTDIKWHYENYNGRVMDPLYFGDNDWHCWDEQLYDIDCP